MIKKFDILTLKKEHFKYDPMLVKELMYVSLPMALQYAITAIGVMILQVAVNSFGSTTVAAFTAATKVEQLVVQPGIAIGMTMATYAAQNLGARRIDRVRQGVRQSTWITILTNALSSVIVIFLGSYIVQLFIPAENVEALPISMEYLKITAIFYPVLGLLFSTPSPPSTHCQFHLFVKKNPLLLNRMRDFFHFNLTLLPDAQTVVLE